MDASHSSCNPFSWHMLIYSGACTWVSPVLKAHRDPRTAVPTLGGSTSPSLLTWDMPPTFLVYSKFMKEKKKSLARLGSTDSAVFLTPPFCLQMRENLGGGDVTLSEFAAEH